MGQGVGHSRLLTSRSVRSGRTVCGLATVRAAAAWPYAAASAGSAPREQRVAEGGEHRVAGAGDVDDLGRGPRRGRSAPSGRAEQRAAGPEPHPDQLDAAVVQGAGGPLDLPVGAGRQPGERGELVAVGGDRVQRAGRRDQVRRERGGLGHADRLEHDRAPAAAARSSACRGSRRRGCRRARPARRRRSGRGRRRPARGRARRWRPCRRRRRPARRRRRARRCRCRSPARCGVRARRRRRPPTSPRAPGRRARRCRPRRPGGSGCRAGRGSRRCCGRRRRRPSSRCRGCWWRGTAARVLRALTSMLAPPTTTTDGSSLST